MFRTAKECAHTLLTRKNEQNEAFSLVTTRNKFMSEERSFISDG